MRTQGDFDGEALARLHSLGGDTLVRRIVGLFDDFAAKKVADVLDAGSSGDYPRVAMAAHALRSSAGNVGASRLLAVATDLEHAARAHRTDVVAGLVGDLQLAFDGARLHVRGFMPGGVS